METKGYMVLVGEPWEYVGYDYTSHVFEEREDAEMFFDMVREEKTQEVIDMNGLHQLTEAEYREEIAENATYDYAEDLYGAWQVRLEECVLHKKD